MAVVVEWQWPVAVDWVAMARAVVAVVDKGHWQSSGSREGGGNCSGSGGDSGDGGVSGKVGGGGSG